MKMGGLKQQTSKLYKGAMPGQGRPEVPGGYGIGSGNGMAGAYAERGVVGRTFNGFINRSAAQNLSIINNKSELVSDLSQNDISAYVSKEKKKMQNEPNSKIA